MQIQPSSFPNLSIDPILRIFNRKKIPAIHIKLIQPFFFPNLSLFLMFFVFWDKIPLSYVKKRHEQRRGRDNFIRVAVEIWWLRHLLWWCDDVGLGRGDNGAPTVEGLNI